LTIRIAVFAMTDPSHFTSPHMVASELVRAGASVRFWTARHFADQVVAAGMEFADILANGPIEAADDKTTPLPARFLTYAAVHAEPTISEVRDWRPDLILYDSFAVIAKVVALALKVPAILVTSTHDIYGPDFRLELAKDPRVNIDPRCEAAAALLRDRYGWTGCTPLSYVADPSPWLNVQVEPEEWYSATQKEKLGPLAFFGGVVDREFPAPGRRNATPHIYASLGTVIWRYWTAEGIAALEAIAQGIVEAGATGTISLGGAPVEDDVLARLARNGIVVERFVDQWSTLTHSDLFITHHGMGSTHEGVACGTPMLSYPFFWDQPALAARSQELGFALPLIEGASGREGRLTASHVSRAIEHALGRRDGMLAALERAQQWERQAIAGRPAVAERILSVSA
jgi:UDP:flavonoid glycosyltransferase YjiC (YdhE family)